MGLGFCQEAGLSGQWGWAHPLWQAASSLCSGIWSGYPGKGEEAAGIGHREAFLLLENWARGPVGCGIASGHESGRGAAGLHPCPAASVCLEAVGPPGPGEPGPSFPGHFAPSCGLSRLTVEDDRLDPPPFRFADGETEALGAKSWLGGGGEAQALAPCPARLVDLGWELSDPREPSWWSDLVGHQPQKRASFEGYRKTTPGTFLGPSDQPGGLPRGPPACLRLPLP